ncbi:MAG TPA: hypothetical protein VNJ01_05495 [Bacteriovoracaceae bacterium]|nr:hypothetical protein [Bacteriovoracaceae bacterium]
MSNPSCSACRHYFITWDAKTPNGCRRFGIKCKDSPSKIISSAGLGECQGFEAKKKAEPKSEGLDLTRKDIW